MFPLLQIPNFRYQASLEAGSLDTCGGAAMPGARVLEEVVNIDVGSDKREGSKSTHILGLSSLLF